MSVLCLVLQHPAARCCCQWPHVECTLCEQQAGAAAASGVLPLREVQYCCPVDFVQEILRQLWAAAYPGEPCDSLKTERWKDMGWQVHRPLCELLVLPL